MLDASKLKSPEILASKERLRRRKLSRRSAEGFSALKRRVIFPQDLAWNRLRLAEIDERVAADELDRITVPTFRDLAIGH